MKHNFTDHKSLIFIETGSYLGDGIQAAINAGFEKIISIELSAKYYNHCKERFKNNSNVILIQGDSVDQLTIILNDIDEICTFWLDGHFSGADTASGKYPVPLMQELEIIKEHHIKEHKILIDDIRLFRNSEWSYMGYTVEDIENAILSINENYKITYHYGVVENDILIAKL